MGAALTYNQDAVALVVDYLGLVTPASEPLEVDHVLPLSRGGDNMHANLTWRCRSHNRARGNRDVSDRPIRPAWERRRRGAV